MKAVVVSVVLLALLVACTSALEGFAARRFHIPPLPNDDPRCAPNALYARIAMWFPLKDMTSVCMHFSRSFAANVIQLGRFAYDVEGQRLAYLLDIYNHTTLTTTQHMVMDYKMMKSTTLEKGKCTFTTLKDPMIHMCSSPDDTLLGEVRLGEHEMAQNIMSKRDNMMEYRVMTKDKFYPVAVHHFEPDKVVEIMFSDVTEGIDEKLFTVSCPRE